MNELKREDFLKLVENKKWLEITKKTTPAHVVEILEFKECMSLAYDLFFENLHDDSIQEFAILLFYTVRNQYPSKWDEDWKNDAFLGELCELTWRYEERYECYKNAYSKLSDPPDSLLLLLAGCNSAPGVPPISNLESEEFLKRALAKKITYEGAIMMRGLYRDKKDQNLEKFWDKKCIELKEKNIHTDIIKPNVLNNKF